MARSFAHGDPAAPQRGWPQGLPRQLAPAARRRHRRALRRQQLEERCAAVRRSTQQVHVRQLSAQADSAP